MKKIWQILRGHLAQDFRLARYAVVSLFLGVSLILNYTFDFKDSVLEPLNGISGVGAYWLFYALPYYVSVWICTYKTSTNSPFSQAAFLWRSSFAIFILALDDSLPYLSNVIYQLFHPAVSYWALKVAANGISFITVMLPLLLAYLIFDRGRGDGYGLTTRRVDLRPYFTLLIIMVPIIIAASFHESFLRQYPMYKVTGAHVHLGVPEWVTVAIYELVYGLDFVTVEYFFRGFLVIGLSTTLGRSGILPMAALYCFLHFGKPAGEAMSSIVGGYILGVIAYETRSIWGGIIIHMGIAWSMELAAFTQKAFN